MEYDSSQDEEFMEEISDDQSGSDYYIEDEVDEGSSDTADEEDDFGEDGDFDGRESSDGEEESDDASAGCSTSKRPPIIRKQAATRRQPPKKRRKIKTTHTKRKTSKMNVPSTPNCETLEEQNLPPELPVYQQPLSNAAQVEIIDDNSEITQEMEEIISYGMAQYSDYDEDRFVREMSLCLGVKFHPDGTYLKIERDASSDQRSLWFTIPRLGVAVRICGRHGCPHRGTVTSYLICKNHYNAFLRHKPANGNALPDDQSTEVEDLSSCSDSCVASDEVLLALQAICRHLRLDFTFTSATTSNLEKLKTLFQSSPYSINGLDLSFNKKREVFVVRRSTIGTLALEENNWIGLCQHKRCTELTGVIGSTSYWLLCPMHGNKFNGSILRSPYSNSLTSAQYKMGADNSRVKLSAIEALKNEPLKRWQLSPLIRLELHENGEDLVQWNARRKPLLICHRDGCVQVSSRFSPSGKVLCCTCRRDTNRCYTVTILYDTNHPADVAVRRLAIFSGKINILKEWKLTEGEEIDEEFHSNVQIKNLVTYTSKTEATTLNLNIIMGLLLDAELGKTPLTFRNVCIPLMEETTLVNFVQDISNFSGLVRSISLSKVIKSARKSTNPYVSENNDLLQWQPSGTTNRIRTNKLIYELSRTVGDKKVSFYIGKFTPTDGDGGAITPQYHRGNDSSGAGHYIRLLISMKTVPPEFKLDERVIAYLNGNSNTDLETVESAFTIGSMFASALNLPGAPHLKNNLQLRLHTASVTKLGLFQLVNAFLEHEYGMKMDFVLKPKSESLNKLQFYLSQVDPTMPVPYDPANLVDIANQIAKQCQDNSTSATVEECSRLVNPEHPLKCGYCEEVKKKIKTYDQVSALYRHIRKEHLVIKYDKDEKPIRTWWSPKGLEKLAADIRQKILTFESAPSFEICCQFINPVRPLECGYCREVEGEEISFLDIGNLYRHLRGVHFGYKEKCPKCSELISPVNMKKHQLKCRGK